MSTQKRYTYLGRTITLIYLDVWNVNIDDSPLLNQDETNAEWKSECEAMTAGFDFVNKLAVDEGRIVYQP